MKRNILYLFVALLLSTIIVSAQAAKATIEGSVVRAGTGQPLKGAKVTLRRAGAGQNRAAALGQNTPDIQNLVGALLTNAAGGMTVSTDASGRFTITGVDPGDYMISAEREGFIRSEFGQRTPTGSGVTVRLMANQQFTANLQMTQASVITGRVLTPDGEPALNAEVQAYTYQYSNGERALAQVSEARTNDLGEYRLFGLEPGEYFVSVSSEELVDDTPIGTVDVSQQQAALRGGRGGAQGVQGLITAALGERGGPIVQALGGGGSGNPPVYFPGTLDPNGATPVPVAAASEVRGIDFNLRPSRASTVSGRVIAPFPLSTNAAPAGGRRGNIDIAQFLGASPVQVNLTREGASRTGLDGLIGLRFGTTPVNPDGSFEIKGVAPGEYNLTATARDPNGQEHTARTQISVSSADVNNVALSLRPGVEVRGRIVLETTPSQEFRMTNLRVSLVAEGAALPNILNLAGNLGGGRGGRGGGIAAQLGGGGQIVSEAVAEDGSFTLKNVGAQEYRVRVTGLPQGAYLHSGRSGATDALNAPFTANDASAGLQLQIGFTPGRVSGAVADARGTAAAGAQVVLVPDEARRGRTDAYFTATSDQNGQFTFNNVPPGNYKLFAWEDIPAGAYQYPDFLRRYEDRGQTVTVNANGTITANVRLIPAA